MSRPLNTDIAQGSQSWDAPLRDNLKQLYKTPMPLPNGQFELADGSTEGSAYTSSGDLPTASNYEGCVATVNNSGTWEMWFSDGTSWVQVTTS